MVTIVPFFPWWAQSILREEVRERCCESVLHIVSYQLFCVTFDTIRFFFWMNFTIIRLFLYPIFITFESVRDKEKMKGIIFITLFDDRLVVHTSWSLLFLSLFSSLFSFFLFSLSFLATKNPTTLIAHHIFPLLFSWLVLGWIEPCLMTIFTRKW